jgi:hypothetical protein
VLVSPSRFIVFTNAIPLGCKTKYLKHNILFVQQLTSLLFTKSKSAGKKVSPSTRTISPTFKSYFHDVNNKNILLCFFPSTPCHPRTRCLSARTQTPCSLPDRRDADECPPLQHE